MDVSGIDCLGIGRVLERGTGEMLEEREDAVLVRDAVSGAWLLGCESAEAGRTLLDRHMRPDCGLLMVADPDLGREAPTRYGFAEGFECFQVAYYGERPSLDDGFAVRTADEKDLPMLLENYDRISPEELEKVVARKSVLIGYDGDRPVGFCGEHLEGSMGLLYVFPEYRRRGFGAALQKRLIARTMDWGFVPFGQVEKDNAASLALQAKLGMTRSGRLSVWMWRDG